MAVAATPTTPKLTAAKLAYIHPAHEGDRVELIDGEVYVTPAPDMGHQHALGILFAAIQEIGNRTGRGRAYFAPVDVHLSESDVVQPDLVFLSTERRGLARRRGIFGAPDLVVEALSPSTRGRDHVAKRALYERSGVREYWLVDPETRTVTLLALEGDRYVEVGPEGGLLRSTLLPGLALDPASLFDPALDRD